MTITWPSPQDEILFYSSNHNADALLFLLANAFHCRGSLIYPLSTSYPATTADGSANKDDTGPVAAHDKARGIADEVMPCENVATIPVYVKQTRSWNLVDSLEMNLEISNVEEQL